MITNLELIIGITIGTIVTILIEEGINRIIRSGAKKAGSNPTDTFSGFCARCEASRRAKRARILWNTHWFLP